MPTPCIIPGLNTPDINGNPTGGSGGFGGFDPTGNVSNHLKIRPYTVPGPVNPFDLNDPDYVNYTDPDNKFGGGVVTAASMITLKGGERQMVRIRQDGSMEISDGKGGYTKVKPEDVEDWGEITPRNDEAVPPRPTSGIDLDR